jgi:hypothetical protein
LSASPPSTNPVGAFLIPYEPSGALGELVDDQLDDFCLPEDTICDETTEIE